MKPKSNKECMDSNKVLWNEMTPIHVKSDTYAVDEFKRGKDSLHEIEVRELGNVSGKSLLHLQCHFGLDSLSWARRGAKVMGIDFSDKAIDYAKKLSKEIGVPAVFRCCNIYELDKHLEGIYDIVYTSYGVLAWLPDINHWARIVSHFTKPGGIFYIVEFHPFAHVFADENANDLKVHYPYFQKEEPLYFPPGSTYADKNSLLKNPSYEWQHSMGDIINALVNHGLAIQFLHEFPYSVYQGFPFLVKGKDGRWYLPDKKRDVPLMFSLMAKRIGKN
jgi:SAM-dependent methyltransferase